MVAGDEDDNENHEGDEAEDETHDEVAETGSASVGACTLGGAGVSWALLLVDHGGGYSHGLLVDRI